MMYLRTCAKLRWSFFRARTMVARDFHVGIVPECTHVSLQEQQQHHLRTSGAQRVSLLTPIFQVFGSNTNVGKTIVSAGVCRAVVRAVKRAGYVKPLQTGTAEEGYVGDATFITRHASSSLLDCDTLFSWKTPVSPHLAATLENHTVTDDQVIQALTDRLEQVNNTKDTPYSLYLVETAGGVCSPSASMRFQADVYRGLRLPVLLVGDGRLGGISATISALESLLIRGYDIASVCIIEQDGLDNAAAIKHKLTEMGIPVFPMKAVPPQPEPLDQWFQQEDATFDQVVAQLEHFHTKRLQRFQEMQERSGNVFWWPFTQHKSCGELSVIDSAHGDEFSMFIPQTKQLKPMFDACASWWTQGIGHGNAKMATALAYTAGRYGHVMFPENTHEPAFRLSERLLAAVGKPWASRVYFSDDGSTAVEVALKMAFRKFMIDHGLEYTKEKLVVLAQTNCYHGDTLGVMNIAEPSVFNKSQHPWYRPEGVSLKTPSLALQHGKYVVTLDPEIGKDTKVELPSLAAAFDYEQRDETLATTYRDYVNRVIDSTSSAIIGAVLLEPILIGAGGMVLVDPLFQRIVVQECRQRRIPVVFDEVFSGWWRLGVESGRDLLQIDPDIACYAKLLTGGVVPLAATLASEEVFNSFYSDGKADALLHGHSFTAYPIGCAAALTALDMYDIHHRATATAEPSGKQYWNELQVAHLSQLPNVDRAFALGTVMCVELKSVTTGYASGEAQELVQILRKDGVYARGLGNVVYMMCSPLTSRQDCSTYLTTLSTHLQSVKCSYSTGENEVRVP